MNSVLSFLSTLFKTMLSLRQRVQLKLMHQILMLIHHLLRQLLHFMVFSTLIVLVSYHHHIVRMNLVLYVLVTISLYTLIQLQMVGESTLPTIMTSMLQSLQLLQLSLLCIMLMFIQFIVQSQTFQLVLVLRLVLWLLSLMVLVIAYSNIMELIGRYKHNGRP